MVFSNLRVLALSSLFSSSFGCAGACLFVGCLPACYLQ